VGIGVKLVVIAWKAKLMYLIVEKSTKLIIAAAKLLI
jgi:hypothetical protein